jgi:Cu-Zn family superoxide dismutase
MRSAIPGVVGRAGRMAIPAAAALALAGCQLAKETESLVFAVGPAVEARLAGSNGATVTGAAVLKSYDGGVLMTVNFNGAGPGEYRVVIHANGNCTSRNAFSAGAPWLPPGQPGPVPAPTLHKNDDSASLVVRLPGYRIEGPDGIMGRAVVVHAGAQGSLEAQPGVPNNRIACGVIGPPRPTF